MRRVLTTVPGRILGQVQVQPAKFNVELCRVLCLRPGLAGRRPGRVLGRAIPRNRRNHGE